mmetsp:Transcript_91429/g.261145  ORF Transcript_91429/g.261145 Transcript_91429/m.261145 type:complete len:339 (+) Transcript_91429:374-1390(+)
MDTWVHGYMERVHGDRRLHGYMDGCDWNWCILDLRFASFGCSVFKMVVRSFMVDSRYFFCSSKAASRRLTRLITSSSSSSTWCIVVSTVCNSDRISARPLILKSKSGDGGPALSNPPAGAEAPRCICGMMSRSTPTSESLSPGGPSDEAWDGMRGLLVALASDEACALALALVLGCPPPPPLTTSVAPGDSHFCCAARMAADSSNDPLLFTTTWRGGAKWGLPVSETSAIFSTLLCRPRLPPPPPLLELLCMVRRGRPPPPTTLFLIDARPCAIDARPCAIDDRPCAIGDLPLPPWVWLGRFAPPWPWPCFLSAAFATGASFLMVLVETFSRPSLFGS